MTTEAERLLRGLWYDWLRKVGVVTPESAKVLVHEDAAGLFATFAAEWLRDARERPG